jgi:hypothetical protein
MADEVKTRIFVLHDKSGAKATVTIVASMVAGAEQNLVILDDDCNPIATLILQPGFDRREL